MASGPHGRVTGDSRLSVRAACESDLAAALALVGDASAKTRWLEQIPEMLEEAIGAPSDEYRACIAECGHACVGVGVYGSVAGCVGTEVILAVVVTEGSRDAEIARAIVGFVVDQRGTRGTRLLVAEVAGKTELGDYRSLLESAGLIEESRIPDYYRDGVDSIHYRLVLR